MEREPWSTPLLAKYAEMLRLRVADRDRTLDDPRAAMRALAAEFPGALREIDEIPFDELVRREAYLRARVADEAPGEPPEPWGPVMHRYHVLLRGALRAKRWLAMEAPPSPSAATLREAVAGEPRADEALAWAEALDRLTQRGRVVGLVMERLMGETGLPREALIELLFAFRRRR